ncbi:hypothetical protein AAFC00_006394 [Neodothiora populina]|uniref:Glycylpeptide N-tetradecanoyltransferase n=1 Tax=Neodothiora populina TaxID=2781224 RepID=A0ABR3P515_9PEZI
MPQEESKPVDQAAEQEAVQQAVSELKISEEAGAQAEEHKESSEDEAGEAEASTGNDATKGKKKSKKSKKQKLKNALSTVTPGSSAAPVSASEPLPAKAINALSDSQISALVAQNPALAQQILSSGSGTDQQKLRDAFKNISAAELLTGMSKGKNAKDMASYKFWSTQPVPKFDDDAAAAAAAASSSAQSAAAGEVKKEAKKEGPIKEVDINKVPKEPSPLVAGFEWSEVDLEDPPQLDEVQDLLCNHYVEDDEAMFRFNYLKETLAWALKAPGWRKSWHVGVRASKSRKLVAFISAIPLQLRVRDNKIKGSEVNFLCIHKKLRAKRLAPVLIMEITRRCNLEGVFQAIYTAGVILPKPVASCRYFHRALDWEKLYSVGFSPLPSGSTKQRQVIKYRLPDRTATPGLRLMEAKDVDAVHSLLNRYLKRVKLAQEFSKDEVAHWFIDNESDPKSAKRVVWTYVVEDSAKKITDFFSFYCLESSVIHGAGNHSTIRAAYMFYYGTESAFVEQKEDKVLSDRLNLLAKDALILAKQARFDVFNALTLLDNPLFLEKQLFGAGDGQLHYYLFNYRTADLPSGVDAGNHVDARQRGGVGVVML